MKYLEACIKESKKFNWTHLFQIRPEGYNHKKSVLTLYAPFQIKNLEATELIIMITADLFKCLFS